jgi:hypothetical protein
VGRGSEEFSLAFWVATFCGRGGGTRLVRGVRVRPVFARKRPWMFRVGLAEVWRWFWVATFFVPESRVVVAVFRWALVFRVV